MHIISTSRMDETEPRGSRNTDGHHISPDRSMKAMSMAERLALLGVSTSETGSEYEDASVDLELQDFSEDSNESEYSYEEEEDVNDKGKEVTERLSETKENGIHKDASNVNGTMDLVALGVDDGEEIDSDEERDIMKEIREEIQNKVRSEMKDEIQMYKSKIAAIEQGDIPGDQERKQRKEEEEENMDPQIKEALIKMRKLDRILTKRMKREREVKRDRILLEKRIREEIQGLKPEGREHKEVKVNTEKFVSLALPPSHNEGISVEPEPTTPLFQTQLNEQDFPDSKARNQKSNETEHVDEDQQTETSSMTGETSSRLQEDGKKAKKKKKKDFIKRNKELAANADETIAMTDEERKRVGELLADIDVMVEPLEEFEDDDGGNPFQMLPIRSGEGYCGDEREMLSLANIDGRLKDLLPEDEFESLVSTPYTSARDPQHKLFTRVNVRTVGDIECYGERALIETKEQREMQARLQRIEEELSRFNNPEEIEIETPMMTENKLKDLLDECVRSLSRSSCVTSSMDESTPRSDVSSVVGVLENPPRLTEEVLQQLLAEAHFPLSAKLEAVREEEEERCLTDTGSGEPGEAPEKILAETWKAIAESDVYDNELIRSATQNVGPQSWSKMTNSVRNSSPSLYRQLSRQSNFSDLDENRLVLPEISHSPFLVSQGLNNQISKNEAYHRQNQECMGNSRESINMLKNNLTDMNGEHVWLDDMSDGTLTPRPPSTERVTNPDCSSRSRTVTPLNS